MENKNQNQVEVKDVKNAVQTAKLEKDIADQIFNRVNEMEQSGQLMFPANYSVGNALKSAYLVIQETYDKNGKPALEVCTKISVANSLLDMVLQGLNPVKKQCYFIVHGNKLMLRRSYFGSQVALANVVDDLDTIPYARPIYEGDEVETEFDEITGEEYVTKHISKFENRDNPIKGAYALLRIKGEKHYEIMTKKEIDTAWSKGQTDKVQKEFPQEMTKRTVINRLCKRYINTTNDKKLMALEAFIRTTENEYTNEPSTQLELQAEVDTQANQKPLIIEGQVEESKPETEPTNGPEF